MARATDKIGVKIRKYVKILGENRIFLLRPSYLKPSRRADEEEDEEEDEQDEEGDKLGRRRLHASHWFASPKERSNL